MVKKIRKIATEWLGFISIVAGLVLMVAMLQYYVPALNSRVELLVISATEQCRDDNWDLQKETYRLERELSHYRFAKTRAYMEGRISEKEYNEQY